MDLALLARNWASRWVVAPSVTRGFARGPTKAFARRNAVRTIALLGVVSVALLVAGSRFGTLGWWVAVAIVVALNTYVFRYADNIALRAMHAYPVGEAEHPLLHRVVREVSSRFHVPMPRVFVSPTSAATSFAAGRRVNRAAICCTEGLLEILDERELRSVVAHELAHIRNRDTLVSSAAGAVASVALLLGGLSLLAGEDDDGPGGLGGLLLLLLSPLAAGIVMATVKRSREYDADTAAVHLTGDPLALAGALRKIELSTRHLVLPADRNILAAGHMMITDVVRRRGFARLFASHPPISERIARLEQMAGYRR